MTVGAILPAAGRGTRMATVTEGAPKELIPLGGRTVLDFVLDEAREAASHVCVVSAPGKPAVDAHVQDRALVVHQDVARGFAHAVRLGIQGLPPCDAYVVLLPDTLFSAEGSVDGSLSSRLVARLDCAEVAIAAERVPEDKVHRYGILETKNGRILRIKEKPMPHQTESRLAVSARYAFRASFADFLERECQRHDAMGESVRELSLTPVIGSYLAQGGSGLAMPIDGWRRLDCGDPDGYADAREVFGA